MAQGRKRDVALVAALAAITCERAQDRPRALATFTGLSGPDRRLARMARPAAERATGRRRPAPSRLSAVFAEPTRAARASSVITAVAAPGSCLARVAGQVRPQPAGIPVSRAPRAGGRRHSCAAGGPGFSDRPLRPRGGVARCAPPGFEYVRLLTGTSRRRERRGTSCASSGVNSAHRPFAAASSTQTPGYHSPGLSAYNAWYSLSLGERQAPSIRGRARRSTAGRYRPEGGFPNA